MANSDYTVNSSAATFAAMARLAAPMETHSTQMAFNRFSSNGSAPAVGDAVLIGEEVMRVDEIAAGLYVVGRGCMDTIPYAHPIGAAVWFLKNGVGTNRVAYGEGEDIGVKTLPRGVTQPPLPIASSPPTGLTFARRFDRPYPPANVKINGVRFDPASTAWDQTEDEDLVLTWVHRNRVTQADQLVDHTEASITPETDTTYTVEIYDPDDVLLHITAGITGLTQTYPQTQWIADGMPASLTVKLSVSRDGLAGLYSYSFPVAITPDVYGLGFKLGTSLGGIYLA